MDVRKWNGVDVYVCPACEYGTDSKRLADAHPAKCRGPKPDAPDALAVVSFASAAAKDAADSAGLVTKDFAGLEPSGSTGFTKGDVDAMLAETEE